MNIFKKLFKKDKPFSSAEYWETRYKKEGNSGAGSYGRLAEFKARVINKFVEDNNIQTVIEFGCGDGNQLSLANYKEYLGFDVSKTVLDSTKKMFENKPEYKFALTSEFADQKADLVLSLDVIFHLVEDEVYKTYMDNLVKAANKFVIIYSSNHDLHQTKHVRHHMFTKYIEENYPQMKLIKKIDNEFPFDEKDPDNTSFADFYIYEINKG